MSTQLKYKEMSKNYQSNRTRNWTSILYPESAAENWEAILREQHINFMISPLHDKDISADGSPKKAHYHICLCFISVKTQEQAQKVFNLIGAINCQPINDIRMMARYLCHLDDYEKAQYNTSDVKTYGLDYSDLIKSSSDEWTNMRLIEEIIDTQNFVSYRRLCAYLRDNHFELYKTLSTHTYHFSAYLKSIVWERDTQTGDFVEMVHNHDTQE